ncbi:MAG: hypothetical protein JO339_08395, partial [Alphaproteobacteria bacterium]|nr:hypothetical protein [Alphaproteobacteria bacterium]
RRDGSAGYLFRHALVQDVAYASLLYSRRRLLHGRVAAILQQTFPEVAASQPEVIARHLTEAQLFADAVKWWRKAGHRCARASSNSEAIEHFSRGLRLLERLPEGSAHAEEELELRIELGVPLAAAAGYMAPEFSENFTRALELSRNGGEAAKLFPVLWAQYTATFSGGDMASSEVMSANFLKGAEQQESRAMLVVGHRIHGNTKLARGDLRGARRELERSLALYRDPDDNDLTYFYGQNQRVAALSYLCLAMQQLGYLDQAPALCLQAVAGAEEVGHFHTKGYALAGALLLHMLRRDPAAVRQTGRSLGELSEHHAALGWSLLARTAIALAEASISPEAAPLRAIRGGVQELQSRGWNFWVPWFLMEEARVLLNRQVGGTAEQLLDEAQKLIALQDYRLCKPDLHALRARMLAESAPSQLAAQEYQRAIDAALAQDAILPALRAATALVSLMAGSCGEASALTQLAELAARFSEGLESPDMLAAKKLLDKARPGGARL